MSTDWQTCVCVTLSAEWSNTILGSLSDEVATDLVPGFEATRYSSVGSLLGAPMAHSEGK